MGQYYKPINLDNNEWLYSHDYDNGLKLMEHSWLGNNFVAAVERLLSPEGEWYGHRLVWAGDYADEEETGETLYGMCQDDNKITPFVEAEEIEVKADYIVNHTLKEFVNKKKVPVSEVYNDFEWRVHPLPLLTCEGNGRGGGDYRQEHEIIGRWARHEISLEKEIPTGYEEIIFDLVE